MPRTAEIEDWLDTRMQLFTGGAARSTCGFQAVVQIRDEELVAGFHRGETWTGVTRADVPTVHVDHDDVESVLAGRVTATSVLMAGSLRVNGSWASIAESAQAVSLVLAPRRVPVAGRADDRPLVVLLAGPNDENGVLGSVAADRALAVLRMVQLDPRAQLILTGGYGAQFNTTAKPHWCYGAEFLSARGLRPGRIAGCVESRHTYEDLLFAREVAGYERATSVTVVTSAHHVPRVKFIASLLLPEFEVRGVDHPEIAADQLRPLVQHETVALGRTVAAAILFGPDRLTGDPDVERHGSYVVWR